MLSKSAALSDSTSALDRPIARVMRALTIPVLISDVDTRRIRLSTCISFAHENFLGARPFERRKWEIDTLIAIVAGQRGQLNASTESRSVGILRGESSLHFRGCCSGTRPRLSAQTSDSF